MEKIPSLPNPQVWDALIATLPGAHFLQTAEWAQVKEPVGWQPQYLVWYTEAGKTTLQVNEWSSNQNVSAAALVLQRELRLGRFATKLRVLYAPKGPLLDWENIALRRQVLTDLQIFAQQQRAIFIKIDPDVLLGQGFPGAETGVANPTGAAIKQYLENCHWRFSNEQVQFRNTVLLDLTGSEEDILARMKQKTRYNIRLASRKGVTVRQGDPADHPMLYRMYVETSLRDGFIIRDETYYQQVWKTFGPAISSVAENSPQAFPLIAEVDGEAVAALVIFVFARRAWYVYGMSREVHREKMPNHLLQWEAIRLARNLQCLEYDLWGAPDDLSSADPMWGVYRFKEGLGGKVTRFLGAWDYVAQPVRYRLYTQTLPRIMDVMRRKSRKKNQQFSG